MKKFLSRLSLFLVIVVASVIAVNVVLWNKTKAEQPLTFFYKMEVDNLVGKYNFLKSQELRTGDNIFIGSSKTYRHLNPVIFDSLDNNENKTYNLATGNFFPFRTIDFTLLLQQTTKLKGVNYFIELNVPAIFDQNFRADPIVNSVDVENAMIAKNYFANYTGARTTRWQKTSTYFLALGYKYLNLGFASKQAKTGFTSARFEENNRGFLALDDQSEKEVLKRHKNFLKKGNVTKDPVVDNKKMDKYRGHIHKDAYFKYLLSFAKKIKATGNELTFFIPPRVSNQKFYVLKAYTEKLREQGFRVIDLADMQKYPELYTVENSFDNVHLNKKGAALFTKYFWSEYTGTSK